MQHKRSLLERFLGESADAFAAVRPPDPPRRPPVGPLPGPVERFRYQGVELELPAALLSERIRDAFQRGYYEAEETQILPGLIADGDVILEIGAGIGFVSTIARRDRRPLRVVAVEANPALIPVIHRTHDLNDVDVEVLNEILAHEDGEATLYAHADFWSSSTIAFEASTRHVVPRRSFQRRLDEIRPNFLVVDIEGGEASLFDGISLDGVQKIMMEVHQHVIGRDGIRKLFDTLSRQGFHYSSAHSYQGLVTFFSVDAP